MPCHAAVKIVDEYLGILAATLANEIRGHQLGIRVNRNVNPLVAKLCRIVLLDVPRLLADIGPNLIALQTAARELPHPFV